MPRSLTFGVVFAVALSLAACGQDGNTVQSEANAKAVAIMPAFAPLYPGADVQTSIGGGTGPAAAGTGTFTTPATPDEIIGFYRDKAVAAGMQEVADTGNDFGTDIFAAQRPGMALRVTAGTAAGGTNVQVLWSPQLPGE